MRGRIKAIAFDPIYTLIVIAIWSLFLTTSVLAQDSTPPLPSDDQVNAIAKQMYCPVCENTPLDVCPTQACAEWRELIRDKLAEGWTEEQIKRYFVDQFGDRVLATPPARGINWFVYIIPPLAILAGIILIYRAFITWRKIAPAPSLQDIPQGKTETGNKYVDRLEEELRKH